jgi:hypothetical protein
MGEAKLEKIKKLRVQNGDYKCIFCGGNVKAITVDHVPPKVMFRKKVWPEGFEFPACLACNSQSSDNDLIVGLMARMTRDGDDLSGLFKSIKRQRPHFLRQMIEMSASEARRSVKKLNISKPKGLTFREVGVVNINNDMKMAVKNLASKLSKALYFRMTDQIFPINGGILFYWFTNAQLHEHGYIYALDALSQFRYQTKELKRANNSLRDQFDYRHSVTDDANTHLIQVTFGNSFGFVTIMNPDQNEIIALNDKAEEETNKRSCFELIK